MFAINFLTIAKTEELVFEGATSEKSSSLLQMLLEGLSSALSHASTKCRDKTQ